MHDLNWFRNNLDVAADRLATRNFAVDKHKFRELDMLRRSAVTEAESLKAQTQHPIHGNRQA